MNPVVLLAVALALVGLRFLKPNALVWAIVIWIGLYVVFRFGIEPPVPSSVTAMFMGILAIVLLAYLSVADERLQEVRTAVVAFFTERRFLIPLVICLVGLPALVALKVYTDATREPLPPVTSRTIHPPPPATITFRGRTIDLVTAENPFRELESSEPEAFRTHVREGLRVYHQNCVFCHGDNMDGDGIFAHGFDPIPADFQDPTTIAMLQESYLFWRIATGGPGLPVESTPWSSAMPAWETFLTEDEIWEVILYLYDYTGRRPRASEAAE
jgi:mono/diheme cytochrome c family protein